MAADGKGESRRRRKRAWRLGLTAETRAVWMLRLKGYRIVARRYRTAVGEIDIVARRGSLLAMIEVKARDCLAAAAEAVTPRQRQRVTRAAAAFIAARPRYSDLDVRFDAVFVRPWRWPTHLEDAWRQD